MLLHSLGCVAALWLALSPLPVDQYCAAHLAVLCQSAIDELVAAAADADEAQRRVAKWKTEAGTTSQADAVDVGSRSFLPGRGISVGFALFFRLYSRKIHL